MNFKENRSVVFYGFSNFIISAIGILVKSHIGATINVILTIRSNTLHHC